MQRGMNQLDGSDTLSGSETDPRPSRRRGLSRQNSASGQPESVAGRLSGRRRSGTNLNQYDGSADQSGRVSQNPFIGLTRFFFVIGRLCISNNVPYPTVLRIRIRCLFAPGSGIRSLFAPGSGIRNRFFPYPGSQIHTFDSLITYFWVKTTIILSVLANQNFFTCSKMKSFKIYDICDNKIWLEKTFSPSSLSGVVGSGIRNGIKIRIRDKHPGSATLETNALTSLWIVGS
jgi:hypothetical protein